MYVKGQPPIGTALLPSATSYIRFVTGNGGGAHFLLRAVADVEEADVVIFAVKAPCRHVEHPVDLGGLIQRSFGR
jgi:hypothetical protein